MYTGKNHMLQECLNANITLGLYAHLAISSTILNARRTSLCLFVAAFLQSCLTECIERMFLKYLATEASEVLGRQVEGRTGWPIT